MLQDEAKKTSDMLANVSTPTTIQDSMIRSNRFDADTFDDQVGSKIEEPTRIESPTEKVFRSDTQRFKEEFDPTKVDSRLAVDKELKGSAAVQRGQIDPPGIDFSFLGGDRFKGGDGSTTRAAKEADFASGMIGSDTSATRAAKEADFASGSLGISADPSATRAAKEADFASGTIDRSVTGVKGPPSQISGPQVEAEVKQSALKTLGNSVTTALRNIKTPTMMLVDTLARPVGDSPGAVAHAKNYFTDRGDGRIGGNPATDLYAGFNRVSKFGNLEKAGAKRLATRQKTIERKGYKPGDKFYDDTQKMKDQEKSYKASKKSAPVTGTTKPGESGGSESTGGGKIVCTMMNQSYGFGSFRNKIWMKFHKDLSPEYQRGYHRLFLPLVRIAKTNKIIKNILEHIAIHSTIDMRQTLRGKKHTLGRLYRKILLPLCYWVGKI
jgi:hypothetical protein